MLLAKSQIYEALNRYFCSVLTSDNGITPDIVPCVDAPPIDDVYISEEGTFSLLKLNVNKSPGIDAIPNAFLVRYAEWSAKYLYLIFKKSLSRAEFPSDWKYAKISPIPKKIK